VKIGDLRIASGSVPEECRGAARDGGWRLKLTMSVQSYLDSCPALTLDFAIDRNLLAHNK
jgi:hypothetical protein